MSGIVTKFSCAILGLGMTLAPALAGTLDIDGTFGDAGGCRFVKNPQSRSDLMLVLTPDRFQTADASCEFEQVLPAKGGGEMVTMRCGKGGDAADTTVLMRVFKDQDGADAYDLFAETGEPRGRVERCPK